MTTDCCWKCGELETITYHEVCINPKCPCHKKETT